MTGPAARLPFGVYVHWPFCRSKCPYCDFNSHVRDGVDHDRWQKALLAELDHALAGADAAMVDSVFFGGGTPSLMAPATVAALLDRLAAKRSLAPGLEVTLEANPTSVEAGRLADFRAAGINRVSLGVQALEAEALAFLGREHGAGEALAAVALARRLFDRVSFDLIYARPGQGLAAWAAELDRALALGPDHLSLYQLTIEENTGFFGAWKRGKLVLPDEDLAADLFDLTQTRCQAAGLPAYEISNHARPGQACRHNLLYWRYGAWIGVGPGAHGRPLCDGRRRATAQTKKPEAWLAAVEAAGHGTEIDRALETTEAAEEALMMGLRLAEGIDADHFRLAAGVVLAQAIDADALASLRRQGLVESEGSLRASAAGARLLNHVLERLAA